MNDMLCIFAMFAPKPRSAELRAMTPFALVSRSLLASVIRSATFTMASWISFAVAGSSISAVLESRRFVSSRASSPIGSSPCRRTQMTVPDEASHESRRVGGVQCCGGALRRRVGLEGRERRSTERPERTRRAGSVPAAALYATRLPPCSHEVGDHRFVDAFCDEQVQ